MIASLQEDTYQEIFGFIDEEGKLISDLQWSDAGPFSNGLAYVKKDELYGYINTKGEVVIAPQWFSAHSFTDDGIARVEKRTVLDNGSKVLDYRYIGYIRKDGGIVSDFQWTDASDFSEGLAYVKKDGKYGYINMNGDIVIDLQFSHAGPFSQGRAVFAPMGAK